MVDASGGKYLSFYTSDSVESCGATGEAIRLALADAIRSAGADVDLVRIPHEPDWVFYGVRMESKFTVVLVVTGRSPCSWFIALEGAAPELQPAPSVREWAHPIFESVIDSRTDTSCLQWHASHHTLKDI